MSRGRAAHTHRASPARRGCGCPPPPLAPPARPARPPLSRPFGRGRGRRGRPRLPAPSPSPAWCLRGCARQLLPRVMPWTCACHDKTAFFRCLPSRSPPMLWQPALALEHPFPSAPRHPARPWQSQPSPCTPGTAVLYLIAGCLERCNIFCIWFGTVFLNFKHLFVRFWVITTAFSSWHSHGYLALFFQYSVCYSSLPFPSLLCFFLFFQQYPCLQTSCLEAVSICLKQTFVWLHCIVLKNTFWRVFKNT